MNKAAYTYEENEWLKSFFPYHSLKEVVSEFKINFGRDIGMSTMSSHCCRDLKLNRIGFRFTKEEVSWLKENYPKFNKVDKTYEEFCKKFGAKKDKSVIVRKCWRLGVLKRKWSKEESDWLISNYQNQNTTIHEAYKKFCEKFPDRKTFSAFQSYAKKKLGLGTLGRGRYLPGNINHKEKLRRELNISDEYILSDLGNGEYLPIEKKVYSTMKHEVGAFKNGDITKTIYEITKVRQKIKELEK